jgi:hypothetical protein
MSAKELIKEFLESAGLTGTGMVGAKVLIPEVVHGFLTVSFAIVSCIIVFFINRWLKKTFPEKK